MIRFSKGRLMQIVIDTVQIWECINPASEIHRYTLQNNNMQQNTDMTKGIEIWMSVNMPLLQVHNPSIDTIIVCFRLGINPKVKNSSWFCSYPATNEGNSTPLFVFSSWY